MVEIKKARKKTFTSLGAFKITIHLHAFCFPRIFCDFLGVPDGIIQHRCCPSSIFPGQHAQMIGWTGALMYHVCLRFRQYLSKQGGHMRDKMMFLTDFLAWHYLQFSINRRLIGFHMESLYNFKIQGMTKGQSRNSISLVWLPLVKFKVAKMSGDEQVIRWTFLHAS